MKIYKRKGVEMNRIRTAILMVLLTCLCMIGNAQIFNQKSTQLRRLAEQVAALNVYKQYLKKGYNIARTGLTVINDFKNGDLNIHRLFFSSLKLVNPNIKNYSKVAEIILMRSKIRGTYRNTISKLNDSGMYGEEDLEMLKKAFQEIQKESERMFNDLMDLVTDGNLELKDDERIKRIDKIYNEMSDVFAFHSSLRRDLIQMEKNKKHQKKEVEKEKIIHGID